MAGYLGNKTDLTPRIIEEIRKRTTDVTSIVDPFSGSGSASFAFKKAGFAVTASDLMYSPFVMTKARLENNEPPSKQMLEFMEYLNSDSIMVNPPCELDEAFIYQNYSPHDDCQRMYFISDNAKRIDYCRQWIEQNRMQMTEQEYYYLIASLIQGVYKVANVGPTFAIYKDKFQKRALNTLQLKTIDVVNGGLPCQAFNLDCMEVTKGKKIDVAYIDPPYNERQYPSYYHIPETIALYDYPELKDTKGGQRVETIKMSDFCKPQKARSAFHNLFNTLDTRYIFLSYSNRGLLSIDEVSEIMKEHGKRSSFDIVAMDYKYLQCTSHTKDENKENYHELLFFIEK